MTLWTACKGYTYDHIKQLSSIFHSRYRKTKNHLRTHCISVRLNNTELQLLNTKRGSMRKGEWLRMASFKIASSYTSY